MLLDLVNEFSIYVCMCVCMHVEGRGQPWVQASETKLGCPEPPWFNLLVSASLMLRLHKCAATLALYMGCGFCERHFTDLGYLELSLNFFYLVLYSITLILGRLIYFIISV